MRGRQRPGGRLHGADGRRRRRRPVVEGLAGRVELDGLLVYRCRTEDEPVVDALRGQEGAFLPCSFWLVDAVALIGRTENAHARFERLLELPTDLGLLAEEYDPAAGRRVGNFPQAFSHVALVNSALLLSRTS